MKVARLALVALLSSGCGSASKVPPPPAPPPVASPVTPQASAATDPLGPRPVPQAPVAYVPPEPRVLEGPGRSKVWLLERHNLPLVTAAVVVPYGSALEPAEQGGLAFAAADMLDEGAGDRDALAFSQAVNDLGAHLASSADRDASVVSLQVLAGKLEQALALMADAITRPRHDPKDWTRVQALWVNALKNRAHDPDEVARVATPALFYGDHPYAHPPEGTLTSAQHVALGDIASWHKRIWRPDVATFIVVGDVTADKVTSLLAKSFTGWKTPTTLPVPPSVEPYLVRPKGVRTFVVDRADAPQVVMSFASAGPRAGDGVFARLGMLNIGLGGSFTSRLNQNLREDHGWTYGARSRFTAQRGAGMFVVRAAIKSDAISPALREARKEVDRMAKEGLADAEVDKLRALVNGDALESYATVHGTSASLATNASLGLASDQDVKDLASQRSATAKDLSALAAKYLDLSSGLVVLVGPKDLAVKALSDNGLPSPEFVDGDGKPLGGRVSGGP
jgi:predicted Zn-dependent peptidase